MISSEVIGHPCIFNGITLFGLTNYEDFPTALKIIMILRGVSLGEISYTLPEITEITPQLESEIQKCICSLHGL